MNPKTKPWSKKIEFLELKIQMAMEDINRWTAELIEARKFYKACEEEQKRWKKLNESK